MYRSYQCRKLHWRVRFRSIFAIFAMVNGDLSWRPNTSTSLQGSTVQPWTPCPSPMGPWDWVPSNGSGRWLARCGHLWPSLTPSKWNLGFKLIQVSKSRDLKTRIWLCPEIGYTAPKSHLGGWGKEWSASGFEFTTSESAATPVSTTATCRNLKNHGEIQQKLSNPKVGSDTRSSSISSISISKSSGPQNDLVPERRTHGIGRWDLRSRILGPTLPGFGSHRLGNDEKRWKNWSNNFFATSDRASGIQDLSLNLSCFRILLHLQPVADQNHLPISRILLLFHPKLREVWDARFQLAEILSASERKRWVTTICTISIIGAPSFFPPTSPKNLAVSSLGNIKFSRNGSRIIKQWYWG